MLGNLSVNEIERRLGITFTDEQRKFLEDSRQHTCSKVSGTDSWHCYDIPFMIECGTKDFYDKVMAILQPYVKDFKCQVQVAW